MVRKKHLLVTRSALLKKAFACVITFDCEQLLGIVLQQELKNEAARVESLGLTCDIERSTLDR